MSDPGLHMGSPGDLIAAVPALLGVYPINSLIVAPVRGLPGQDGLSIAVVFRHDLHIPGDQLAYVAAQMAAFTAAQNAATAVVLLVDATASPNTASDVHTRTLAVVERALADSGIAVGGAWATRMIEPGETWWALEDPSVSGLVPDPETTPIAQQYAASGRTIHRSRDAIAQMLEVNPALAHRVRELLGATTTSTNTPPESAVAEVPVVDHRVAVQVIIARVDRIASGATLTPTDLADLAVALRTSTVRLCVSGLADTHRAAVARQLWAVLTRSLPDPERADAATLLAFAALYDSQAALADVAARAALVSAPEHREAQLLLVALQLGTPPRHLHVIIQRAHELAATLDIDLDR